MAIFPDLDERDMQRQLTTSSDYRLAARSGSLSGFAGVRTYSHCGSGIIN